MPLAGTEIDKGYKARGGGSHSHSPKRLIHCDAAKGKHRQVNELFWYHDLSQGLSDPGDLSWVFQSLEASL